MNLANDLSAIRSTTREFLDRTHGMVIDVRGVDADFSAHILRYMAGWPSNYLMPRGG